MKLAVITIGDEILSGFTVNTNTSWLGQKLLNHGINVDLQVTVSDKKDEIVKYLEYLTKEKYTHILVTGGLGPTHDDVTTSAFYKYFGSKPVFDNDYWEYLKGRFAKRNIKIPEKNRNQATCPDNGEVINNPVGSARGLFYNKNGIKYFAMPGVPSEMKGMMTEEILPIIISDFPSDFFSKTIRTIGLGESAIAERLEDLIFSYKDVKVAFLPQLGKVDIRVFSASENKLDNFVENIEDILQEKIYGYGDETIEGAAAKLLINNKMTVATAESCTGGLLGHRLTNVSGSSSYMEGGVICYTNDVKIDKVGVAKQTIIDHGAVSEETVYELAVGIKKKFNTDIGIGITGVAGPTGGTDEKPVGLVYIGLAVKDKIKVKRFQFVKERIANKLLSSQTALNMLRLELLE